MTALDKIKMEVETPTAGLQNLIRNPRGGKGAWGWITPNAGQTITGGTGSQTLRFNVGSSSIASTFYSEPYAIASGQWAGGSIKPILWNPPAAATTHGIRARVQFLDASKAVLTSGAQGAGAASGTALAPSAQAPLFSAYVRLRVDVYKGASGNPDALVSLNFASAMLVKAATDPGSPSFVEPITWTDVTGKSLALSVDSPALGPGIASCAIVDPSYDIGGSAGIGPGRLVRLSAWDGTQWAQFYEGAMGAPQSTYDPKFKVSFDAVNAVSRLASITRVYGVGTIAELPYILEGQGIAWNCQGPGGNQVASATIVARNDNAKLLDQVTVVRDGDQGFAWVDQYNVLQVIKRSSASTTPIATLSDAAGSTYSYRSIDVDKGSPETIINTINVTRLKQLASGKTKEIRLGPYTDTASVDAYGAREATYTLQGAWTSASIATWAQAILTANATPIARANSVTITARTDAERALVTSARHYDVLRITKTGVLAGVDHRIVGIHHEVIPTLEDPRQVKHLTTFALVPLSTIPPPTAKARRDTRARAGSPPATNDDTEGDWQNPTMLNSWAGQAGWAAPGYMKQDGYVFLKGSVVGGAAGTNLFILPPGCRPAESRRFPAPSTGGTYGQVHILATGNVQHATGTVTGYVCLDGISFPAEQ